MTNNTTKKRVLIAGGGMRQSICTVSSDKEEPTNLNTRRSILKSSNTLDVNPPNYHEIQKERKLSGEIQLNVLQY